MNLQTANRDLELGDLLHIALRWKWLILLATLLGAAAGGVVLIKARPLYASSALVQLEIKESFRSSGGTFSQMSEGMTLSNPTEGEVEIFRSQRTLQNVVRRLNLDMQIVPRLKWTERLQRKTYPVFDVAQVRYVGKRQVEFLEVTLLDKYGRFRIQDDAGRKLLEGEVGMPYATPDLELLVRGITGARVGDVFRMIPLDGRVIAARLEASMNVEELGKKTGLFGVTVTSDNPGYSADVANAVAQAYIEQDVERRRQEVEDKVGYLEGQIPFLQAELAKSEEQLSRYRNSVGVLDAGQATNVVMTKSEDIARQIAELKQRRNEALERFQPGHSSIRTLDSALQSLYASKSRGESALRNYPVIEKEIGRLERQVRLNNDRYTEVVREAQQYRILLDQRKGQARIVDVAQPSGAPIPTKAPLFAVLCVVLGLVGGTAVALAIHLYQGVLFKVSILEDGLGVPVLAFLPRLPRRSRKARAEGEPEGGPLQVQNDPHHFMLEALRSLRPWLVSKRAGKVPVVLVTSPVIGDGKSTVTAHLAAVMAQSGLRTVLVDTDIRQGRLHAALGVPHTVGLCDALLASDPALAKPQPTKVPRLSLVTSGNRNPAVASVLSSSVFESLLETLAADADLIIMDSAPVLAGADAELLSRKADAVLLVVRYGKQKVADIDVVFKKLTRLGAPLAGLLVNDVRPDAPVYGRPFKDLFVRYPSEI